MKPITSKDDLVQMAVAFLEERDEIFAPYRNNLFKLFPETEANPETILQLPPFVLCTVLANIASIVLEYETKSAAKDIEESTLQVPGQTSKEHRIETLMQEGQQKIMNIIAIIRDEIQLPFIRRVQEGLQDIMAGMQLDAGNLQPIVPQSVEYQQTLLKLRETSFWAAELYTRTSLNGPVRQINDPEPKTEKPN